MQQYGAVPFRIFVFAGGFFTLKLRIATVSVETLQVTTAEMRKCHCFDVSLRLLQLQLQLRVPAVAC